VFLGLDYLSVWVKLRAEAMEVPSSKPGTITHKTILKQVLFNEIE